MRMCQSRIEIDYYSVAYFKCITTSFATLTLRLMTLTSTLINGNVQTISVCKELTMAIGSK